MLGYCAFGRGQPKRAERDVMRTTWLGSCSLQLAQPKTLRPWDNAMAGYAGWELSWQAGYARVASL
jgi:hypothetical protein